MSFIEKHAGGLFQKLGSNKLIAKTIVKGISKDEFLADLREAWASTISGNSDTEEELRKAVDRIKKSGYESVFKSAGITEKDLRQVITDIKENKVVPVQAERKMGRNEPCPCGSGRKYKRCCGA